MKRIIFAVLISLFINGVMNIACADGVWENISSSDKALSIIETGPNGIYAGEYDGKLWLNPYNGVYHSKDFGITWDKVGLDGRGITGLVYSEGKIYAATYYIKNSQAGLFISQDKGQSWVHFANNYSLSTLAVDRNYIYIGSFSHGLWWSGNDGATWEQKIGDGLYGPKINAIEAKNGIAFASTDYNLYRSVDNGNTWSTVEFFNNKSASYINITNSTVLIGTTNNLGLYKSEDSGATWRKINNWGNYSVGKIISVEDIYYAGKYDTVTHYNSIFTSSDRGNTWGDIGPSIQNTAYIVATSFIYGLDKYFFAITSDNQIYRYKLPSNEIEKLPFLNIPWSTSNDSDLVDKIYSYFDHEYPLLGYYRYKEPEEVKSTTLNYLGIKNKMPFMYYSSHDGYDYSLKYGTPILAAAGGTASYYYCKDCGNTIKIDHQNGYQTIYMHLQSNGLITKTSPTAVTSGIQIGLVGMTGNTTGPHLHFAVLRDKDANTSFEDNIPDGRIDPYGWQSSKIMDPWENAAWQDSTGEHTGIKSIYLWRQEPRVERLYIENNEDKQLALENALIQIPSASSDKNLVIEAMPYSLPIIATETNLAYVPNTALILSATDHFGQKVDSFIKTIKISYKIADLALENIISDRLKLYFWDDIERQWAPLITTLENSVVTAETNHLSYFALMGEKIDSETPNTTITITGNEENGWYYSYPIITLIADKSNTRIFYSHDNEEIWYEYIEPFGIYSEGVNTLKYRSLDDKDNIENTQERLINIDTKDILRKSIKILDTQFNL